MIHQTNSKLRISTTREKNALGFIYIYYSNLLTLTPSSFFYSYSFNYPLKQLTKFAMAGVHFMHIIHFLLIYVFVLLLYAAQFFTAKALGSKKEANLFDAIVNPLACNSQWAFYFLFCQSCFMLTCKGDASYTKIIFSKLFLFYAILLILSFILLIFLYQDVVERPETELISTVMLWLHVPLTSLFFIHDFIAFLLVLEFLATVYYFFFLTFFSERVITLIKFKNLISNYLWISFFTLICFFCAMLVIVRAGGSLAFVEMFSLTYKLNSVAWKLFLGAFLWKVGSPGFYFFKLEIYQYLPTTSLLFFSLSGILLNSFIFYFFFTNCFFILHSLHFVLLCFILVTNSVLLLRGTRIDSLYQFLGLSAVNTWALLLLFFFM